MVLYRIERGEWEGEREKESDRVEVEKVARNTGKNIPEKMGFDVTVFVYSIRYLVTLYLR